MVFYSGHYVRELGGVLERTGEKTLSIEYGNKKNKEFKRASGEPRTVVETFSRNEAPDIEGRGDGSG